MRFLGRYCGCWLLLNALALTAPAGEASPKPPRVFAVSLQALAAVKAHADSEKKWPHKELRFDRSALLPLVQQAAAVYDEARYRKLPALFPADEVSAQRARLLFAR